MKGMQEGRRAFIAQTVGALTGLALVPDPAELLPQLRGPRLRVGLVGAGRQGRAIAGELQKISQVDVVAVCDSVPARLKSALDRVAGAEGFADYRVLLEKRSDVQAVIVATPTHQHRAIVVDALAAERHVYCEAPVASTVEDCRALAAAAASARTVCQAGLQARSNPTYRRAQPLVQTELRQLVSLYAQSCQKTSWRVPAAAGADERALNWRLDPDVSIGLAGEQGTHQFDVAHWMRGSYPVRAAGGGAIRLHDDGRALADTIELDLVWDDGIALHYEATLASSYGGQYEVIQGVNGTIRLAWTHGWLFKEADAPTQGWEVYATRQQFFRDEGIVLIANATQLAAQGQLQSGVGLPHPSLYYALVDFVRSATEGAPVTCSMAEGARASTIGILANQAIVTGRTVEIRTS